jgi:integrase/recombinase XerD
MSLDRTKYLRPDEVQRLLAHLDREAIIARARGHRLPVRDEAMFKVGLVSGYRASDLAGLKVSDLHLGRGAPLLVARKTKGGKRHEVSLPSALKADLRAYLAWMGHAGLSTDPEAPLFPSRTGSPLTRSAVWRRWKAALDGAQLPLDRPLHASRHTCGVLLYRTTKDLRLVQRHLGHARPSTTAIYADVLPEDVEAGVDATWKGLAP